MHQSNAPKCAGTPRLENCAGVPMLTNCSKNV